MPLVVREAFVVGRYLIAQYYLWRENIVTGPINTYLYTLHIQQNHIVYVCSSKIIASKRCGQCRRNKRALRPSNVLMCSCCLNTFGYKLFY